MATISARVSEDTRMDQIEAIKGLHQHVRRHARESQVKYDLAVEKLHRALDAREDRLKSEDLTLSADSPWYLRYEISYRLNKAMEEIAKLTSPESKIDASDFDRLAKKSAEAQVLKELLNAKNGTERDATLEDEKLRRLASAMRIARDEVKSAHRELSVYPTLLLQLAEESRQDAIQGCKKLEATSLDLEQFISAELARAGLPSTNERRRLRMSYL